MVMDDGGSSILKDDSLSLEDQVGSGTGDGVVANNNNSNHNGSVSALAADSDGEQELSEDEYLVESIVDYTRRQGVDLYLVKWKGWASKYNSWEPETNLSCTEKLLDFFKSNYLITNPCKKRKFLSPVGNEVLTEFRDEFGNFTDQEINECFCKYNRNGQLQIGHYLTQDDVLDRDISTFMRFGGRRLSTGHSQNRLKRLRRQLLLRCVQRRREEQLQQLQQWCTQLRLISNEQGNIEVENNVDLALPPQHFRFGNDCVAGEGVVIPCDPVVGCECSGCGPDSACCARAAGARFAYSPQGRLRLQIGQPIYECNSLCGCPPSCPNRVVQHGRKCDLAIFRTSNDCGWGVKTLEPLKKGTFVAEYVGEVVTNEEAERRGEQYDANGCTYLFDLDFNDSNNKYTVDAAHYGNVSHFINHSCEPNLVVYGVWVDCLDPEMPRLALFAIRDIRRGEQLTFDYQSPLGMTNARTNVHSSRQTARIGSPSKPVGLTRANECRCGAKTCRRSLFDHRPHS